MSHKTLPLQWQSYLPGKNSLHNKIILITGAADGIGKAVSMAAAKQGATVIMLDKKTRHLEKVYDSIIDQGFTEPVMLPFDLLETTPQSIDIILEGILTDFGRLDGLLHNAAELGSPSPLDQYDIEYWQKVMLVNLQAPYFLTRGLLPALKESKQAQVLFTSAKCGRAPSAYWGAYGVAYGGIEVQMKIWAEELENPSDIIINSIDPGAVRTSFRRRSHPGESQDSIVPPQDITNAYMMLFAGEHSHFGEQLTIQE